MGILQPGGSLFRFGLAVLAEVVLDDLWHRPDNGSKMDCCALFGDGLDAAAVDPRCGRAKQKPFWCDKWHSAKNILDHLLAKVINVHLD